MKYDLKRPCPHCPFRNDIRPYLRAGRVEEIRDVLEAGGTFACHKTTVPDEDGGMRGISDSQFCAGALILLDKEHGGPDRGPGVMVNQLLRIMFRLGVFNPNDLDHTAPVYDSFDEMASAQE